MNFRITTAFFAVLLTMLWVFGLMIAHKKAAVDQSLVMASLSKPDVKIDKVFIKGKEKDKALPEIEFVTIGDQWFLKEGEQKVRVEGFRVDSIVKQIKSAKNDDTADTTKEPAYYGLNDPKVVVTLVGTYKGEDAKWEFYVGNESGGTAYVNSSDPDRKDKVYAVSKKSIDSVFVKDANHFRSKKIFQFTETAVNKIDAKKDADELELSRPEGSSMWTFVKPKLGFAGFESEPEEKKKDPHKEAAPPPATGGVKGLLTSIMSVRVDDDTDFVPLGKPAAAYGVKSGEAKMQIQIASTDQNKLTTETLLIGDEVPNRIGKFYYARLESDDGVMQISSKWLDPIIKAIKEPGKLRSLDVAAFDPKQADVVLLTQGDVKTEFYRSETGAPDFRKPDQAPVGNWEMLIGSKTKEKKKANSAAVNTLIEQVLGKKAIVEFPDPKVDVKKKAAEWGLEKPTAVIAVYLNSLEKDKKEEKKDDKDKKDDKGKKDDKEKKEEVKKDSLPGLKEGAKPEVTIAIGKVEKDVVHILRTLKDGTETYFTMKKEFVEKVLPAEGVELAYLDTSLPVFGANEVTAMRLQRTTDKETKVLDMVQRGVDGTLYWFIKDARDSTGYKRADNRATGDIVNMFAHLPVKKWIKKLDGKEDLKEYGLADPVIKADITVKNTAKAIASVFGRCAMADSLVMAAVGALYRDELDTGANAANTYAEVITIKIGKEVEKEKDKTYATHTGSKLLFTVPSDMVKLIRDKDLYDRSGILYSPVSMTLAMSNSALNPINTWMFASPYLTGAVQHIDPKIVKDVRLLIRTKYEARAFHFERIEKPMEKETPKEKGKDDKTPEKAKEPSWTWIDKSTGLIDFKVDPDKVAELVKDFSKLQTNRFAAYAGGPRTEQKLDPSDATIKLDFITTDSRVITITIGANYLDLGHFATSSQWVGADGKASAVFFVPRTLVDPILQGTKYFGKVQSATD